MINIQLNLDPNNAIQMRALAAFAKELTLVTNAPLKVENEVKETPKLENEVKETSVTIPLITVKKKTTKVEAPKVEAPKVEAPKVEAPKVEAPKAEAPKNGELTLEAVRALTRDKAVKHRDAIKETLMNKFAAENVLKLDPEQYQAYVDYLNSLS